MSEKHEFIKNFIGTVLISGASNIGSQLLEAVNDENQPIDVALGKVVTALKSGAFATGRDLLRSQFSQNK
jgi:hypothetical protein